MKTSNKLLLIATLIMFGYLVVFNFQLKAEYLKGDYKSQFYGMQQTPLNSFNTIEHKAANLINLHIEKGPVFAVWMNESVKDRIIITQRNNTLYIDYKDKTHFKNYLAGIIVTCPAVNSIIAKPITIPDTQFWSATTTISGFDQDVMNINANRSTEIELTKNAINNLNAGTGESNAALTIQNDNQIKNATFKIAGKSLLKQLAVITNPNYSYTDSATITLNGKSFHQQKAAN